MPVIQPAMTFPWVHQAEHSNEIIHVVLRSLASIDNRLIEHGERVAFLAQQIASVEPRLDVDEKLLFILCILHDIGAYKTEEIDNMAIFENTDVARHAAYGYLFCKHLTRLSGQADAILYHHTDYRHFPIAGAPNALYAQLIYLADRIDMLLSNGVDPTIVERFAPSRFHPDLVRRYAVLEGQNQIAAQVCTGAFRQEMEQFIGGLAFSNEEILDFLNLLVCAMDFRSECTVAHTANTTSISVRLGQLMNLPDVLLQKLYYGATFHDIGKISIPVEILEKTGRLTDEEMILMRTHVVLSETILRGVIDDEICDIAVRHHEKLNGKGYPHGLSAKDLSLPQRILAVADVMSALNGKRSYKEKFTKSDTLDILNAMRNRGELCPAVCAVMTTNYDSIIQDAQMVETNMDQLYKSIRDQYDDTMNMIPMQSNDLGNLF